MNVDFRNGPLDVERRSQVRIADGKAGCQVEPLGHEPHPSRSRAPVRTEAGREDQVIGRPRQGDIQEAQRLGFVFLPFDILVHREGHVKGLLDPLGRGRKERPELGVIDGAPSGPRGSRSMSATMTTGNSSPLAWWMVIKRHDVARLRVRGGRRLDRFLADRIAKAFREIGERPQARPVEFAGHFDQLPQVGDFAAAQKLVQQRCVVPRSLDGQLQQAIERHPIFLRTSSSSTRALARTWSCCSSGKSPGGPAASALSQRGAKTGQSHERVVGKAEKGGPQNADEGDCVVRIVQIGAQIDEVVHFLLRKKVRPPTR